MADLAAASSLRILLESVLRRLYGAASVRRTSNRFWWQPGSARISEVPFVVGRVLLQDFTVEPLLVDLAAMRSAVARRGLTSGRCGRRSRSIW